MTRMFRYFNKTQVCFILISMLFIVMQVWLDLKLPDYRSAITTLVQTDGSPLADIPPLLFTAIIPLSWL